MCIDNLEREDKLTREAAEEARKSFWAIVNDNVESEKTIKDLRKLPEYHRAIPGVIKMDLECDFAAKIARLSDQGYKILKEKRKELENESKS